MQTKEQSADLWTQSTLDTFKYALQGEIGKKTPCRVEFFTHPQSSGFRGKNILGVRVDSGQGSQLFELWTPHKGDQVYWDYFKQGGLWG